MGYREVSSFKNCPIICCLSPGSLRMSDEETGLVDRQSERRKVEELRQVGVYCVTVAPPMGLSEEPNEMAFQTYLPGE